MKAVLAVGCGGFLGAVLRYGVYGWVGKRWGLVVGTFGINVVGSFVLGALMQWVAMRPRWGEEWRLVLGVGLLGAFTTFSTFEWEVLGMLRERRVANAAVYVGTSVLVGLAAAWAGMMLVGTREGSLGG